ncbi:MAG: serine/threonine-protein phosphatase [Chloroflexi bacterium]|nr:MAG: serine/threonine-protein phosphatase [Chloroflexota bacterium]
MEQPGDQAEKTIPVIEDSAVSKQTKGQTTAVTEGQPEKEPVEPVQFLAGCGQSVGRQRDHNEDALFTLTTNLITDIRQIPFGLYIVADGMGGHQNGEKASASAVRAMAGHILRKLYIPLLYPAAKPPEQSIQEIMQEGVHEAHRSIIKQAIGGGTTLTTVLLLGDQMTIAHVGDSRVYLFQPDGKVEVITRDHSLVKRLEELGQITAEEAAVHPQRNVLYRALGQGEPFDPDTSSTPIPHGARLLICSDGLWGQATEQELSEIVWTAQSPELACQQLLDLANASGGPDNITAILVKLPD